MEHSICLSGKYLLKINNKEISAYLRYLFSGRKIPLPLSIPEFNDLVLSCHVFVFLSVGSLKNLSEFQDLTILLIHYC